jgi:hypothetical protein
MIEYRSLYIASSHVYYIVTARHVLNPMYVCQTAGANSPASCNIVLCQSEGTIQWTVRADSGGQLLSSLLMYEIINVREMTLRQTTMGITAKQTLYALLAIPHTEDSFFYMYHGYCCLSSWSTSCVHDLTVRTAPQQAKTRCSSGHLPNRGLLLLQLPRLLLFTFFVHIMSS